MAMKQLEQAIVQYAIQASVPILEVADDLAGTKHCGTGFFYEHDSRLFLITARHVFDKCDQESLAVPKKPTDTHLTTLGAHCINFPDDELLDVAVVEIQETELAKELSDGWYVLSRADIADFDPLADYFILGFPVQAMRSTGKGFAGKPQPIFMSVSDGKPTKSLGPAYTNVDMFFDEKNSLSGFEKNRPKDLHGISGSAIWKMVELDSSELWAPRKALKIVGVQCECRNKDYIRGKQWQWIEGIINRL